MLQPKQSLILPTNLFTMQRPIRWLISFTILTTTACHPTPKHLPILGQSEIRKTARKDRIVTDTIYPTVHSFTFLDQDSNKVSSQSLSDKIYVADFIFLSCPAICPKLTHSMQRVYTQYVDDSRIVLLSHTIDPQHDTIPRLHQYCQKLGLRSERWHFLTGNQDTIMNLAEHSYYTMAYPDSTAPGGFAHGGGLLLVDKNKHIRGVYSGVDSLEIDRLIQDIHTLLDEEF